MQEDDLQRLEQALSDLLADADQDDPEVKRQIREIENQIKEIKGK
jgi:hypothetical protein